MQRKDVLPFYPGRAVGRRPGHGSLPGLQHSRKFPRRAGFAASASVALGCSSLKIGAHARSGAGEPNARFLRQFDEACPAVSARQHKPAKIAKTFVRIDDLEAGRLGKRFALRPGPARGVTWKPSQRTALRKFAPTGRPMSRAQHGYEKLPPRTALCAWPRGCRPWAGPAPNWEQCPCRSPQRPASASS
jgi:hypothetical protein